MAFPFFTKPFSAPSPKMSREQIPSKPAQPKRITTENKPGFLGSGRFRQQDELIAEVRKPGYFKDIPTYSKKFSETERIKLVKDIERASGAVGGLSESRLGMGIKKFEKQKQTFQRHQDFKKAKELDEKIKQAKAWQKAWSSPRK